MTGIKIQDCINQSAERVPFRQAVHIILVAITRSETLKTGSMSFPVVGTRFRSVEFMPKGVDPRYLARNAGTVRSGYLGQSSNV